MRIETLRIGMTVQHPDHGRGVIRQISETQVHVDFADTRRVFPADDQGLAPAEPLISVNGPPVPIIDIVRQAASAVLQELGIDSDPGIVEGLARKWNDGTMVLRPADAGLQEKEVPIGTFFHKIVMMRNNLRVLEQKVNSSTTLSEADKVDWQQYITRCYGSMTSFNVLFKEKEDHF